MDKRKTTLHLICMTEMKKKLQILEEINENSYKIDKGSEVPSIAVKKLVTKTHDHFHQ